MNNIQKNRVMRIAKLTSPAFNLDQSTVYTLIDKVLEAKNNDAKIYALTFLLENLVDKKAEA
jgi:hypothetical protein